MIFETARCNREWREPAIPPSLEARTACNYGCEREPNVTSKALPITRVSKIRKSKDKILTI